MEEKIAKVLKQKNEQASALEGNSNAQLIDLEAKLMMIEEEKQQALDEKQQAIDAHKSVLKELSQSQQEIKKKVNQLT